MRLLSFLLVLLSSLLISVNGLKILSILPIGSKSHWAAGHSIIKALVDAGHEATVYTTYPMKKPINNYNEIDISEILEEFKEENEMNAFEFHNLPSIAVFPFLHQYGNKLAKGVLNNPKIQKLMASSEKYDICLFETFHANAISGIFDHVDCTYVPFTSGGVLQWADVMTSNQSPTSYVVNPELPYAGKLNFKQRFWNVFFSLVENLSYYLYHLPSQRAIYNKYFPNAKHTFDEMITGVSLIFLSNHISIAGPRPYLPNMIEIGGIHIPPKKELPENIKKFLDSATDGAVLFSMGSIVKATDWPIEMRETLVRALGKLKQKVLWKYENETLPNKPDNVMISSWIPQRDVFAHPNVKLFISHGGYLGTTEATAEGVPILGMPIYGDQPMNIAIAEKTGRGLLLEIDEMSEEKISHMLNELLTNPKYKENAVEVAKRFHDRPMTPQQTVVYWTEYVARHKGAKFLRSVGNDYNTIEFYSVDAYAALVAIIFVFLYLIIKLLKIIIRKFFAKSSNKQKIN